MIHLMELPNPDPLTGRPEHGGRDRHACISIRDVSKLKEILDKAGKFCFINLQFILVHPRFIYFIDEKRLEIRKITQTIQGYSTIIFKRIFSSISRKIRPLDI